MKFFPTLLLLATSWLFVPFAAQSQSPCFRVSVPGVAAAESTTCTTEVAADPFVLPGNSINFQISDNPRSLNAVNTLARYKAFWIFGDGNFAFHPHGELPDDLLSNTQPYQFHRPGTYSARAVLSEKKSNDVPPPKTQRMIQVNSVPANSSPTPFKKTLDGTENTLDIFNSEVNRPKHPTAFAVSVPKLFNTYGVFFFYNSSDFKTPDKFLSVNYLDEDGIELPWYMTTKGIVPISGLTSNLGTTAFPVGFKFSAAAANSIINQYQNFIFISLNDVYSEDASGQPNFGEVPDLFDEFRFFPVLKTILYDGTRPWTRFGAVALSLDQASPSTDTFFTSKRLASLGTLANALFNGASLPPSLQVGTIPDPDVDRPVYATGAQILNVEMKGSIDPNKLVVMKICPKSNGQYEVRFRVEVCNQGYEVENAPQVIIKDPHSLFQTFQFEGTVNNSGFAESPNNLGSHNWSFTWNTPLGAVPGPGDAASDFQEQCAEFFFTATTNWEGVQKLTKSLGLEMCVVFPSGGPHAECHYNYSIDSSKVSQDYGFECIDPPPPCTCGLLCWLLIIVLLAILLWWWWKKQQNNSN